MLHEEPTTLHPRREVNGVNLHAPTPKPRPIEGAGVLFWGPIWGGALIAVVVLVVRWFAKG